MFRRQETIVRFSCPQIFLSEIVSCSAASTGSNSRRRAVSSGHLPVPELLRSTAMQPVWRGLAVVSFALPGWCLAPTCAIAAENDDPFRPPAIVTQDVPAVPAELMERLRQYQAVRSAAFRGWSPDGKGILIATRFGDTAQLHRVYEPGGRREQITFFNE